ncbi:MAG: SAM hydroxide adenosyltransferase [Flavobacteriales bacterium AspAUS03]
MENFLKKVQLGRTIIYIDYFGNVVINITKKVFEQVGKNVLSKYRHAATSSER